jgi:RNA polymerase sigma factor (sigma-70 family)
MTARPSADGMTIDQNSRISEAASREQSRLRNFVRKRVANPDDVDDVVQEVFSELVESLRLMRPIEHIGPWLFRVARNRIIDLYRKRRPELSTNASVEIDEEGSDVEFQDLLASSDPDPEAAYEREVLFDELEAALAELPAEQRDVFIANTVDGRSFAELSEETGVNVNTLLARKRYAVRRLRERLQGLYNKFMEG